MGFLKLKTLMFAHLYLFLLMSKLPVFGPLTPWLLDDLKLSVSGVQITHFYVVFKMVLEDISIIFMLQLNFIKKTSNFNHSHLKSLVWLTGLIYGYSFLIVYCENACTWHLLQSCDQISDAITNLSYVIIAQFISHVWIESQQDSNLAKPKRYSKFREFEYFIYLSKSSFITWLCVRNQFRSNPTPWELILSLIIINQNTTFCL